MLNWALLILNLAVVATFVWAIQPAIKRARAAGHHIAWDNKKGVEFMRPELPIILTAFGAVALTAVLRASRPTLAHADKNMLALIAICIWRSVNLGWFEVGSSDDCMAATKPWQTSIIKSAGNIEGATPFNSGQKLRC